MHLEINRTIEAKCGKVFKVYNDVHEFQLATQILNGWICFYTRRIEKESILIKPSMDVNWFKLEAKLSKAID